MNRLRWFANSASSALNVIAGISLVAIVLVVTANTISRRTPLGPILGTYEFALYLEGIVIAFAIAYNQIRKVNISVEILVQRLSRRTQAIIASIVYLVSLVLYSVITGGVMLYATGLWQAGEVSYTLHFPFFPIVYAVGLCFALLVLVLLLDFTDSLMEIRKK